MIPPEDEKAPRRAGNTDTGDNQVQVNIKQLPVRLQQFMRTCPETKGGVHRWIFIAALKLKHHVIASEAFVIIRESVTGCGRKVDDREIHNAINNASSESSSILPGPQGKRARKVEAKWPCPRPDLVREVVQGEAMTVEKIQLESPTSLESQDPVEYLKALFPGDPLICLGKTMWNFRTSLLSELTSDVPDCSVIVPSPMSFIFGERKSGGKSMHTLDNTGPRKYLVTEFDGGVGFNYQASIICHLRKFLPLVMVVYSGGKSLHAWWRCGSKAEDSLYKFMRYAVALGADPMTWTKSQFVRLPGGWRTDTERRQQVLFFDGEECAR